MNIKNFATFGLFCEGKLIDNGSIHRMENEAIRTIMNKQADALTISVFGFKGDTIIEETPVLSYRKIGNNIIIANMLLKGGNEK